MDQAFLSQLRALLSEAVQKVPAVRYALGVAGVGAAAAIVLLLFRSDGRTAVAAVAIMFAFMVVMLVFAGLARAKGKSVQYAGLVLMWVSVACLCAFLLMLMSSISVGWPPNFLNMGASTEESPQCRADLARMDDARHSIADFIAEQCTLANGISRFVESGDADDWKRVSDKAHSFSQEVRLLRDKMRKGPDLYRAMQRDSYNNFYQLLDEKGAIAGNYRLAPSEPPQERSELEELADRLRTYATQASAETAQLATFRPASCPSAPAVELPKAVSCLRLPR